jgi:undecaprenyl diphosphate synthase
MTDLLPTHIGYIVDGNRRWAKAHGLPKYEGHLAGYNAIIEVALATIDKGVKYVSMYTFSTENWKRSQDEVRRLMKLTLKALTKDVSIFIENDIRLVMLGSRDGVDPAIIQAMEAAEERTKNNTRGTLALCFNYGGQLEIADACKKIIQAGYTADDVDPDLIAANLYRGGDIPPIDIVVRTSGEQRLSNFMLWRAAYSEFLFLEKPWPDMTNSDVDAILEEYTRRGRRFGG